MSSVEFRDQSRDIIARLELRETRRSGSLSVARQRLAHRLGTVPGTLETLARGRLKRIDDWLRARAETLLIREIEHEISALEHELACLRATGADPRLSAVGEIETALATARKLMERE
ncbi:MAG: hypothetical protein C0458_05585 [Methylobacterium sp.]|nr:hypothetical protein [Methylobacterium sp.]